MRRGVMIEKFITLDEFIDDIHSYVERHISMRRTGFYPINHKTINILDEILKTSKEQLKNMDFIVFYKPVLDVDEYEDDIIFIDKFMSENNIDTKYEMLYVFTHEICSYDYIYKIPSETKVFGCGIPYTKIIREVEDIDGTSKEIEIPILSDLPCIYITNLNMHWSKILEYITEQTRLHRF